MHRTTHLEYPQHHQYEAAGFGEPIEFGGVSEWEEVSNLKFCLEPFFTALRFRPR